MENKPLAIDLYCGLGGWAEALLAEGWDVIGFDIERHDYGTGGYPGQLVLQDVRTLHGAQFRDADLIVASPPCQEFSYRAMPWKRAKALGPPILGNTLFWQCWRIQHEAQEASGREIPLIVENVVGAQKWIGEARWHYGSFYLWGNLPALMPQRFGKKGSVGISNGRAPAGTGNSSWFFGKRADPRDLRRADDGTWQRPDGTKFAISGHAWYRESHGKLSSRSIARKAASAQIAKIPYPLAQHIARVFKP